MDVTPSELRTTELREAWRGYRQDDVDQLLERVTATIERLQGQVQRLSERLAEAEGEAGLGREADEMLRRTLLLAQRTADAAVAEAQERARRVLAESEAHAHSIVSGAEEEARRIAIAERHRVENEIQELVAKREILVADVEALEQTARDHRRRLKEFLDAELARIDARPLPDQAERAAESGGLDAPAAFPPPPPPPARAEPAPASPPPEVAPQPVDHARAGLESPPAPPQEAPHEPAQEAPAAEAGEAGEAREAGEEAAAPAAEGGDLLPSGGRRRRWRLRDSEFEAEPPTDDFFHDLRQAVADEKPLGPRDEWSDPGIRPEAPLDLGDGDDLGGGPLAEAVPPPPVPAHEAAAPPRTAPPVDAPPEAVSEGVDLVAAEDAGSEFASQSSGSGPVFFDQDQPRRRS